MKCIIFIILMANSYCLHAQTTKEWTQQKKTRIEYMLQQVSANKFYIEYIQKGYSIAQGGLQTISEIRHGDFNLHSNFLNALAMVNPKIKDLAKVTGIIAFQIQITRQLKLAIKKFQSSNQLSNSESAYLQQVFNHLLDECTKNISELAIIITSGQSEMTDEERLKRIDGIYYDMQDKLSFSRSFSNETAMLLVQRLNEETDIELSKKLNGVQ